MHFALPDVLPVVIFPLILLSGAYGSVGMNKFFGTAALQRLGDWSFSLYLVHQTLLFTIGKITDYLKEFLKSGNQSFLSITDFCKDSKYEFNNREMKQTAIGTKPEQSELDASVKVVEDYVKANAKDASSIDFLEWSKVSAMGQNWVVRCKYKGLTP